MNLILFIDIFIFWIISDVFIWMIGKFNVFRNVLMIWIDKEGMGGFYFWGGVFLLGRFVIGFEMWKFSVDGRGGGSWLFF